MKPTIKFSRFFSTDSAKAIKADKYGYLNGINYMAPHDTGGAGNLCPHSTAGCRALCLGMYSGQAAMNGSTDINFAGIARDFPETQFIDYTKSLQRVLDKKRPSNYHLTFSLSETNQAEALRALAAGFNVAVVFAHGQPGYYLGHSVIDGTLHDLRHLDPSPCIVGLDPKGSKAKADRSGFVVRDY